MCTRLIWKFFFFYLSFQKQATVQALQDLNDQVSETAYMSVFLRQKHPTGVADGGLILPYPEVISDPNDIHKVGTFAQIHSVTMGTTSTKGGPVKPFMDPTRRQRGSSSFTNKKKKYTPKVSNGSSEESAGEDSTTDTETDEDDDDDKAKTATVLLLAHRRVDLVSVDEIGPPIDVTVKHWKQQEYTGDSNTIRALSNEIITTIREVAQTNQLFRENLQFFPMRIDGNNPFRLADFAASISSAGTPEDLQAVLEERDAEMRLHKALVLLSREREVTRLQQEISSKVEEKMSEAQRKYFLTEQLKSIKKELGMERDDKEALIEKYRQQLAEYPFVPTDVMEVIEAELEKMSTLEKNSAEYNVTRSYLDWLTGVPWGVKTEENFDIREARNVLDRDHYGLDDVKDTILQFIAVGKLKGTVQGKILCLAG